MRVELAVPLVPWLRERHWQALDGVAAAVLLGLLVGGALNRTPQFASPLWLTVVAAVVAAVSVAARRRFPVSVLAVEVVANGFLAVLAVGGNPAVAIAFALYTVAVTRPPRASLGLLAATLVVTEACEAVPLLAGRPRPAPLTGLTLLVVSVLVLATAWALGTAVRARRWYTVRATEVVTRRAVDEERLRIARELHDVITHSMTLMTVKASVAAYLTDSQPEDVRAALTVIESTGRDALAELRRMLGVLRADPGSVGEPLAPTPGLADLPALAATTEQAGVSVELDLDADADEHRELPAGVGLSVYRIVQEALTNVVKHAAPATCRVRVRIAGGAITAEITDDGQHRHAPTSAAGHGIIGMRERAALFGGHLDAAPLPDRGFRVTARLPLSSAA